MNSKADYQAQAEFRYALRQFLRFSQEKTRAVGMTPEKYQALLAIMALPERDYISISELAERLAIQHHSAVGLANRLVRAGLVVRRHCDSDRRKVFLSLTEQGRTILDQLVCEHRQELQTLWSQLQRPVQHLVSLNNDASL